MIRRINALVSALLVVSLSLYVVILNRDPISLYFTRNSSVTTSTGVALIAVFCFGVISATLVGIYYGVRAYLRERALLARERQRELFAELIAKARSFATVGEDRKARDLWQQILRRDPDHIVARIELSRSFERDGDTLEALRVLERARTAFPDNWEVLFRAAKINAALGNKTAALDNLALILYQQPVARCAMLARDLAEGLGRLDEALRYQQQLEELQPGAAEHAAARARISLKKLQSSAPAEAPPTRDELSAFVKKFPGSVDGFLALAEAERGAGNIEGAAGALIKAAKLSADASIWDNAMQLWISQGTPERALATARSALKETSGKARIEAELNLAKLYVTLQMFRDASALLDRLPIVAQEQGVALEGDLSTRATVYRGLVHLGLGHLHEAAELWRWIGGSAQPEDARANRIQSGTAPPPRLSTP